MKYIAAILLLASAVLMSGDSNVHAGGYNVRVACQSQTELEMVVVQWVAIDENGEVMTECSLLPVDSLFESRKIVRGLGLECLIDNQQKFCPVWIVKATVKDVVSGQSVLIWYEVGFLEIIPVDAFEEGIVGIDEPMLVVGLPGSPATPKIYPVTMVADIQRK